MICAERYETLVIENRLSELGRVERWLAGLVEQWALSPDVAFGVDLVMNEAVTNIIGYAYPDSTTHKIIISLADTAKDVVVQIIDDGRAFNPFETPAMVISSDLEHAAVGGRGVHLIKSYADGHYYIRVAGHNRLTLRIDKSR